MTMALQGESNMECDIHADSCILGRHAHIFLDHKHPINVFGYDKSQGSQHNDLQTVSGATAYDDSITGTTVLLIVHQ